MASQDSLTNAPAGDAYPLSAYEDALIYAETEDSIKGRALADFLWWAIHDGQSFPAAFQYPRLPPVSVSVAENRLKSLHAAGKPLFASR